MALMYIVHYFNQLTYNYHKVQDILTILDQMCITPQLKIVLNTCTTSPV